MDRKISQTRVILTRPHDMMRDGIVALLEKTDDIELIALASDSEQCIELAAHHKPHVIVINVQLPRINGIELAHRLLTTTPTLSIVLLGAGHPDRNIFDAIKISTFSYVSQDDSFDELVRAIRAARMRQIYFSSRTVSLFVNDYRALIKGNMDRDCPVLTRRQRQILQLFAEGMTTKQIASYLNVSCKTVASYREQIQDRLQMRGIADLTRYAIRSGIIQPE